MGSSTEGRLNSFNCLYALTAVVTLRCLNENVYFCSKMLSAPTQQNTDNSYKDSNNL